MDMQFVTRPMQWAQVPNLDDVTPFSEADFECFTELRAVLVRFNALDRFGINLIHRHFDVAEDEVLVEYVDVENRTLTVKTMKAAEMPPAVETQWHLSAGDAMQVCHGYCITNVSHAHHHAPVVVAISLNPSADKKS